MVSILGSSAVERSTVNRLVAGSNPARGVSDECHHPQSGDIFFAFSLMQILQSEEIAPACHPNQKISCRAARADLRVTALNPSQSNNFQGHANHEGEDLNSAQTG